MTELAEKLLSTPTGTLLTLAGIAFLLIAVVGNVTGKIEPGPRGRIASGVVGAALLIGGLTIFRNTEPGGSDARPPDGKVARTALSGSNGAIAAKYEAMGGAAGSLGMPQAQEAPAANGGYYIDYQNGYSIYWTQATGAHVMHGAIRFKWLSLGGAEGALGYPTTDETWNGVGFQQDFKHCFMVWTEKDGVKITPD